MHKERQSDGPPKPLERHHRAALAAVVVGLLLAALAQAADAPLRQAKCEGRSMEYALFAPGPDAHDSLPAILLLHGAGDHAVAFIKEWEPLARKKKIVLIAPQLPRELSFEAIAPKVFRCVIDDAAKQVTVDPHRIYLFGHSMGGYLAYDGALLDSGYYAAAVVHAMGIADDYTTIVQRATRKIPIAIYIGSDDQMVSLAQVRKTRDLLKKSGFPVSYQEMPNHGHNYYELSGVINGDAWHFMEGKQLP
jgi:predicted esterase